VSRTTYAALFAKIGTTWGSGDGSTTFNVPALNSRYIRHREVAGAAGAVGTLQADQNKAHTHTGSGTTGIESVTHTHTFSGTTGSMNANNPHSHTSTTNTFAFNAGTGSFAINANTTASNTGSTDINHGHPFSGTTAANSVDHTHPFSLTTSGGSADGTEARPLSASLLFCIRAL
jgi:microcystin-dependent protein